jgi:hydroxyacylglutathione hydrolase
MINEIKTISLAMPFGMGRVNCYLVDAGAGFILIDTGGSSSRKALLQELEGAACKPGLLPLILLTHGDFDHTGNAAYLRQAFGATIAMHPDDAGMGERGDMFVNRKKPNAILRALLPPFTGFGKAERFTPDRLVADGESLAASGFEASLLSLPGHSQGSIGILTAAGDLFCGDLFENTKGPKLNSLMDDPPAAQASLQKLRSLEVGLVYPGHGAPFPLSQFVGDH